jgi:hypothetical protein
MPDPLRNVVDGFLATARRLPDEAAFRTLGG